MYGSYARTSPPPGNVDSLWGEWYLLSDIPSGNPKFKKDLKIARENCVVGTEGFVFDGCTWIQIQPVSFLELTCP